MTQYDPDRSLKPLLKRLRWRRAAHPAGMVVWHAAVGRERARRLAEAARVTLPRPGHCVSLPSSGTDGLSAAELHNVAGRYELHSSRRPGDAAYRPY